MTIDVVVLFFFKLFPGFESSHMKASCRYAVLLCLLLRSEWPNFYARVKIKKIQNPQLYSKFLRMYNGYKISKNCKRLYMKLKYIIDTNIVSQIQYFEAGYIKISIQILNYI